METPPRKIVEPLITIPKPRPSALHQQQMQQLQLQQQQQQQHHQQQHQHQQQNNHNNNSNNNSSPAKQHQSGASIYSELLDVIEEMSVYIRPCYLGHRASLEKVRQLITRARHLVRLCTMETEKSAYQ